MYVYLTSLSYLNYLICITTIYYIVLHISLKLISRLLIILAVIVYI